MPSLNEVLDRYTPDATAYGRAVVAALQDQFPDAVPVVFDAKYAVTVSFTFTGKWQDGFCYVAFYSKHANLAFHRGAELPDPTNVLKGEGKVIRHIRIDSPKLVQRPDVQTLLVEAVARCIH